LLSTFLFKAKYGFPIKIKLTGVHPERRDEPRRISPIQLLVPLSFVAIPTQSRRLQSNVPKKFGNTNEIASPKTLRFLNEAMKPLEAAVSHPSRRFFNRARVKVEGCSHAHHEPALKLSGVLRHEPLLPG
jgi:hypothetical protein